MSSEGYNFISSGSKGPGSGVDQADIEFALAQLNYLDDNPDLTFDSDSVYGAAIALPQIARCSNYNRAFVLLSLQCLVSLVANVALQTWLLVFIGEASQIMAPLGGQMHLCDFGAKLDSCPGEIGCIGPGGTEFTKTRLYGYTQWAVQKFAHQALLDAFPDQHDIINEKVDPGEYGIENYYCRFVCIFLFTLSLVQEIRTIMFQLYCLWRLPSDPEHSEWIQFKIGGDGEKWTTYGVAGMPIHWKVINVLFVFIPKAALCHGVMTEGTLLLMDTAGITDMVLGAMSMTFVLSVDELVFASFSSLSTKHIMTNLMPLKANNEDGLRSVQRSPDVAECCSGPNVRQYCHVFNLLAWQPLLAIVVMTFYVYRYYARKCVWDSDSEMFVSHDMYLPKTSTYRFYDFLFDGVFGTIPRHAKAFWTMPDAS